MGQNNSQNGTKKFKLGDKLEIPKFKSVNSGIDKFMEDIFDYKKDYLLFDGYVGKKTSVNTNEECILKRDDGIYLYISVFAEKDLEHYHECKAGGMVRFMCFGHRRGIRIIEAQAECEKLNKQ